MSRRRIELLEKQLRTIAAEAERLRRGIDNALPMLAAGYTEQARQDLLRARRRGVGL